MHVLKQAANNLGAPHAFPGARGGASAMTHGASSHLPRIQHGVGARESGHVLPSAECGLGNKISSLLCRGGKRGLPSPSSLTGGSGLPEAL